ncbi:MAG: YggS family pyridoxal phosphate-dependent enzyme [Phycisphaerales bacterium]|nr:YggS family pyridoxal phosphate-dependent enzyme [Phycisphaerales bacterium]
MARSKSTGVSGKSAKSTRSKPEVVVKAAKTHARLAAKPAKAGAKILAKAATKSDAKSTPVAAARPKTKQTVLSPQVITKSNARLAAIATPLGSTAALSTRQPSMTDPTPSPRLSTAPARREPIAVSPIVPDMPKALPETLVERYELVKSRIAAAAKRSGRRAEDILLVAVTKYATPEQVRELLALGHRDLGENRVQHLLQQAAMVEEYQARLKTLPATRKAAADAAATLFDAVPGKPGIPDPASTNARWHMIGHLQRNKAKKIVELVRLTHSVDSLRVAEELQTLALKKDRVIDVLIQVNCSGEEQKYGCPIPATIPLAEQIGSMINVRVRGLMTMAAYSDKPEDARETFARCRELFEELRASGAVEGPVNILSMGMTGDFEVAIEEGANCVRIGSAIFGEPPASSEEAESDEE